MADVCWKQAALGTCIICILIYFQYCYTDRQPQIMCPPNIYGNVVKVYGEGTDGRDSFTVEDTVLEVCHYLICHFVFRTRARVVMKDTCMVAAVWVVPILQRRVHSSQADNTPLMLISVSQVEDPSTRVIHKVEELEIDRERESCLIK